MQATEQLGNCDHCKQTGLRVTTMTDKTKLAQHVRLHT